VAPDGIQRRARTGGATHDVADQPLDVVIGPPRSFPLPGLSVPMFPTRQIGAAFGIDPNEARAQLEGGFPGTIP